MTNHSVALYYSQPIRGQGPHFDQSEPSSVPTTYDEEAERPKGDGDTNTMESVQAMGADRAKTFEYM